MKWLGIFLGAVVGVVVGYLLAGTDVGRQVDERRAEVVGNLASEFVADQTKIDDRAQVQTVAGLNLIEVETEQLGDSIFRATGVANTYLIATSEGNVLYDTGLGTQAAKHKRLLQELLAENGLAPNITHIVLSHSHADHIGGTKFWLAEFPDAEVITHKRFREGQGYLTDLEHHFWDRNRLLYAFMPEEPPESGFVRYGGVEPTIEVADGSSYNFELGGVQFEVLPTPGAEGDDNIVLWLPAERALFTGDFFGPLFPMVPNLFTLRGEKFRDPLAYIASLDQLLALQPETIYPAHFDPVQDAQQIEADMTKMRDATRYIHDQTIAGMNSGKSLWQLMREIRLPEHLALSQGHGKVSWNVRSIWEHYSTWFHFESTTELYPTQVRELYPEIAEMIGSPDELVQAGLRHLDGDAPDAPEAAMHYVEIALAADPTHQAALQLQNSILNTLLDRAFAEGSNYSETGWLKGQIRANEEALSALAE